MENDKLIKATELLDKFMQNTEHPDKEIDLSAPRKEFNKIRMMKLKHMIDSFTENQYAQISIVTIGGKITDVNINIQEAFPDEIETLDFIPDEDCSGC